MLVSFFEVMTHSAELWRMDWKGPDERQGEESGTLTIPHTGEDAGLHCDRPERERAATEQREFKEGGLAGRSTLPWREDWY